MAASIQQIYEESLRITKEDQMMNDAEYIKRLARNAKRQDMPLDRVCPNKQPWKDIFTAEYERFIPRK